MKRDTTPFEGEVPFMLRHIVDHLARCFLVVDGMGNKWRVGSSMVGNNVSVVSSDDLAVSTMGHSGSASVGKVGAVFKKNN